MKLITALLVLSFCHSIHADEMVVEGAFDNKIYTPSVVYDNRNEGPKGAVQLLWQKSPKNSRFEVEVSNGLTTYSSVHEKHFHHVMLFWGKDYRWRVREVSSYRTTDFSPWMPVKVMKGDNQESMAWQRKAASNDPEDDQYMLDTGAQNP